MITVDWANDEETVAIWQFRKEWRAEQLYEACNFCSEQLGEKDHMVNIIYDFSYSTHSPKHMMTLLTVLFKKCPANVERIVIFARTSYWERIISAVVAGIEFEIPVHYSTTLEETYNYVGLHEE